MKLKKLLLVSGLAFAMPVSLISLSIASSLERKEPVRANAATPAKSTVFINGVSFDAGGDYFKNGDTSTFTGTNSDYNAYYDQSLGRLYLNDYEGERIRCTSTESLDIYLEGSSVISANGQEETGYVVGIDYTGGFLSISGNGSLTVNVFKETFAREAVGIQAATLVLEDGADVSIDMTGSTECTTKGINTTKLFQQTDTSSLSIELEALSERSETVYGIYAEAGEMIFNSSNETEIVIDAKNSYKNYAIYNRAFNNTVTNNGDISFTDGTITLTNNGTGYADAIFGEYHNEEAPSTEVNDDGLILFHDCEVTMRGFAHGVWNQSVARSPFDDSDIWLRDGARVNIYSTRGQDEFAIGLMSQKNGILIDGADYYYEGTGNPVDLTGTSGFYNNSKYGFDVKNESHVTVKTNKNIRTANDATCDFDLSGSGYFKYMNLEGQFPSNFATGGTFAIKLANGTRILHETHFILDGSYGTTTDGGIVIGHYSGYDDDIIEFRPYVVPSPSDVAVNGHGFTDTKLYYVNDAADTTSDSSEYNAKFEKDTGTLYLNGYVGGLIEFENFDGATLRIVVEADSSITVNGDRYGIEVRGTANIEIFSRNFSTLTIEVTNEGYAEGIAIPDGSLTICGNVYVDVSTYNTSTTGCIARGVNIGYSASDNDNDFNIEDNVRVRVHANSEYAVSGGYQPAVYCKGTLYIKLDASSNNDIVFDTQGVAGDSYAVIASYYEFARYKRVLLNWSKDNGSYCGPAANNGLDSVHNGAVNIDEEDCLATVEYGTAYHIDVISGFCSNAASGNYIEERSALITAPLINGLTFQNWTSQNGSTFLSGSQTDRFGNVYVDRNDVITAHYDFVSKAPWFDTRGATDNTGYIGFAFKGTTTLLRLYDASTGDMAYNGFSDSTKFTQAQVPDGSYYIGAFYVAQDGKTYELFTDNFTINYSAPALDYNVTFHKGAGTGIDQIFSTHGEYTLPDGKDLFTAPENYRFRCWAKGSLDGDTYSAGSTFHVYSDVEFYALYEEIPTHTMTFAGGAGYVSGSMDPQAKREGQNYVLPEPTFVHADHMVFDYWEVNSVHYDVGDEVPCTGDKVAYAVYKYLPQYTLTLSHDENSTGSMDAIVKYTDEKFVLPTPTYTPEDNMEFAYWLINTTHYDAGDELDVTSDLSATAVYTRIKVNVTFSAGEGSGSDYVIQDHGQGTNLTLPTFAETGLVAPSGYRFVGWKNGGNTYAEGESVLINGAITFTAQYEAIPVYTVTFTAGEHGTGSMSPVDKFEGDSYVLPQSGFTADEGYRFKCWSVGGVEKAPGDSIDITGNVTVTAIFEAIPTCSVTFNAGTGGSGTMDPVNVYQGSSYTLPTSSFTAPEGKEFDGWMVNGVKHDAGDSITVENDTVITAVWKDIPVTPVDPVTPDTPAKGGLSGGAIAAIVIASVLVVGVGGFALVWFVILKKTWADFVAIFKKK